MRKWSASHFSLSNPKGPGMDDLPRLLNRLATQPRSLGPVEMQDVTFHGELADDGTKWPAFTVYFHRARPKSGEAPEVVREPANQSVRKGSVGLTGPPDAIESPIPANTISECVGLRASITRTRTSTIGTRCAPHTGPTSIASVADFHPICSDCRNQFE